MLNSAKSQKFLLSGGITFKNPPLSMYKFVGALLFQAGIVYLLLKKKH
jgi:hypothetical protein